MTYLPLTMPKEPASGGHRNGISPADAREYSPLSVKSRASPLFPPRLPSVP